MDPKGCVVSEPLPAVSDSPVPSTQFLTGHWNLEQAPEKKPKPSQKSSLARML
jgi:hypothetical protein